MSQAMRKILMIAVLMLAPVFGVSAATYLSYISLGDIEKDPSLLVIDQEAKIMWVGHAGRAITLCDEASDYFCFESPAFTFSVPKHDLQIGRQWKLKNVSFEIMGIKPLAALGLSIDCFLIESRQGTSDYTFYFSERLGLLAMNIVDDENFDEGFFISTNPRGFPFE
jgi:hypothetical protein